MDEALPLDEWCPHGCPFSSPESCRNKENSKCSCQQCNGECGEDRCDECMHDGECILRGCKCCDKIHDGVVDFGDPEGKQLYDKDPALCAHCLDRKHEEEPDDSDAEDILRCKYLQQLTDYNAAELARAAAAAGASGKRASAAEGGSADASKRARPADGGAAGGRPTVIDISSDESLDEGSKQPEVLDLISDDKGAAGGEASVPRGARVARAASDPAAMNRADA